MQWGNARQQAIADNSTNLIENDLEIDNGAKLPRARTSRRRVCRPPSPGQEVASANFVCEDDVRLGLSNKAGNDLARQRSGEHADQDPDLCPEIGMNFPCITEGNAGFGKGEIPIAPFRFADVRAVARLQIVTCRSHMNPSVR